MTSGFSVFVLGVDFSTTRLALRERVTAVARTFNHWVSRAERADIAEAFVLATCHRVEFYVAATNPAQAEHSLRRHLAGTIGDTSWSTIAPFCHRDQSAVRHLACVASGLASMVLGESEIAGQVRRAVHEAQAAGVCGPILTHLAAGALRASGRVRAETALGRGARSLAGAAVQWAAGHHPRITEASVLVIGAGPVGREALQRMAQRRPAALMVASRSLVHAQEAADGTDTLVVSLDEVAMVLPTVDVVVAGLRTDSWHITAAALAGARRDHSAPIWIADLSVPRVVDPAAARLPGVHLATVDDLGAVAEATQRQRRAAIPHALRIVDEEIRWTFQRCA